jgi:hypothetical protein
MALLSASLIKPAAIGVLPKGHKNKHTQAREAARRRRQMERKAAKDAGKST